MLIGLVQVLEIVWREMWRKTRARRTLTQATFRETWDDRMTFEMHAGKNNPEHHDFEPTRVRRSSVYATREKCASVRTTRCSVFSKTSTENAMWSNIKLSITRAKLASADSSSASKPRPQKRPFIYGGKRSNPVRGRRKGGGGEGWRKRRRGRGGSKRSNLSKGVSFNTTLLGPSAPTTGARRGLRTS